MCPVCVEPMNTYFDPKYSYTNIGKDLIMECRPYRFPKLFVHYSYYNLHDIRRLEYMSNFGEIILNNITLEDRGFILCYGVSTSTENTYLQWAKIDVIDSKSDGSDSFFVFFLQIFTYKLLSY